MEEQQENRFNGAAEKVHSVYSAVGAVYSHRMQITWGSYNDLILKLFEPVYANRIVNSLLNGNLIVCMGYRYSLNVGVIL